jgi:phosphoadenosine phosphosulfate reductase
MLIQSNRLKPQDLEAWKNLELQDNLNSRVKSLDKKIEKSLQSVYDFLKTGKAYAGISWGKDSTVLAHLLAINNIDIPFVWIKVVPIFNPDCELVKENFLAKHKVDYYEETVTLEPDENGKIHASKSLEHGFKKIEKILNTHRYITGIRSEESGIRKMRQKIHGYASLNTLAPLTYWSVKDIFAYLYKHEVPVHPAYAMTMGGLINRDHLRVASIGGKRGSNFDRTEWEKLYYPDILKLNAP